MLDVFDCVLSGDNQFWSYDIIKELRDKFKAYLQTIEFSIEQIPPIGDSNED